MRSTYFILGALGSLVFTLILSQSVLGVMQNKTAKGMTTGIGNSTTSTSKDNVTAGNTTSSSNVTAASGNNGHIYRGGAAAGSGGE